MYSRDLIDMFMHLCIFVMKYCEIFKVTNRLHTKTPTVVILIGRHCKVLMDTNYMLKLLNAKLIKKFTFERKITGMKKRSMYNTLHTPLNCYQLSVF